MNRRGLLLDETDLDRIRNAGGKVGESRERVIAAAEALLSTLVPQPDPSRPWGVYLTCASERLSQLQRCAFAFALTGRTEFHERARAIVEAILEWDSWIDPCHVRPHQRYGLMTGVVAQALAHYLDWCASEVGEEELATIADHYRRKAIEPLLHDLEPPKRFFRDGVNNWVAVMVGGAGMMALLLRDREPFQEQILERCVFHLRRYLTWLNADGSIDEGGGYWTFGLGHAIVLIEALRRHADLLPGSLRWRLAGELHQTPALMQVGFFPFYCIEGDTYVVNFGDTHLASADPMQPNLRWLARNAGDGHLQWLADRLSSDSPLALIWHDPDLAPLPPDDLPPSRVFHDAGWGIMRASLDDPEGVLLAVRAAHNAKTHSHRDLGTFILRAGGRGLIVDPGCPVYCADYWINGAFTYGRETIGHNCVLIDGEGQRRSEEERASITRFEDLGDRKFMTVEVRAEEIGLALHRREFALTLNNPATLTLADEVRLTRPGVVTWLLHFDPEAEAEVGEGSIVIRNGGASLTISANPSDPVSVTVEDHPEVPYIAIETAEPVERATLDLTCTIEA